MKHPSTIYLGDLEIKDIKPYLDVTGSYNGYYEGTMNRPPTQKEMKILEKDWKVVNFTGCFHGMGGAPLGWDGKRNVKEAGGASSEDVRTGLKYAVAMLLTFLCIGATIYFSLP